MKFDSDYLATLVSLIILTMLWVLVVLALLVLELQTCAATEAQAAAYTLQLTRLKQLV